MKLKFRTEGRVKQMAEDREIVPNGGYVALGQACRCPVEAPSSFSPDDAYPASPCPRPRPRRPRPRPRPRPPLHSSAQAVTHRGFERYDEIENDVQESV